MYLQKGIRMDNVLVTTKHKGVFAGQLKSVDRTLELATLVGCRNCISWSESVKGFLGLAVDGPNEDCRIGPKTIETELWGVTSMTKMTEQATNKWESAPWR